MLSVFFSSLFSILGIEIVQKRPYHKNHFKNESDRVLSPIREDYINLISQYDSSTDDKKKAIENQILFVKMIYWLGLNSSNGKKILDIGGKAGLFSYFCNNFGNQAVTTDLEDTLAKSPNKELIDLMGVDSFPLKIEPFTSLDVGDRKFDFVTGFRTRFHSRLPHETGIEHEMHWGLAEWEYFLKDLAINVLKKDGKIFFMLNPLQPKNQTGRYIPEELTCFFRRKGGLLRQNFLYFSDTTLLKK